MFQTDIKILVEFIYGSCVSHSGKNLMYIMLETLWGGDPVAIQAEKQTSRRGKNEHLV